MTPADYIREILDGQADLADYKVYVNHLPDQPDLAIAIYDSSFGRLEGRLMASGDVDEHPLVTILVRGTGHEETSPILGVIWGILKTVVRRSMNNGKIMHCITKANTMGSLGHEPQKRRVQYTQQFRMTLDS